MKTVTLNGEWLYRIGGAAQTSITVPFSRLPVGHSECTRSFDVASSAKRIFLKFDGVTYYAKVFLNGIELGEMLPYCEYKFEITSIARPLGNELRVELEDIDCAFGPSEGWENFGGIIRDVSMIMCEEHYIKDVFFKTYQSNVSGSADIEVEISADASPDAAFNITLSKNETSVCSYIQTRGETKRMTVQNVSLWSPDDPTLYSLSVELIEDGKTKDSYNCEVGFRFLTHDRHKFILNGEPLFLKGVCKHEMVGDSGHCPSVEQMEKDMRMIKDMGCNFVRLVHYPHNKKILEIADRIGLMISEEPGLWWSDTANKEIAEGSKEVLRRTILRDRNHVSVAFWLCFNECRFTERFLIESAEICHKNDPTRMVSGANCMSNEETLLYYNKCGFDFYTMHPYSDTFARAQASAAILCDKPLIFTEWGGYHVYDNPHLLLDFMGNMRDLYVNASENGALAGAFFWFFAELNDFNRGRPACIDGVLREGLVNKYRKPTPIFNAFCQGLKLFDKKYAESTDLFWYERAEAFDEFTDYSPLAALKQDRFAEALERTRKEEAGKGTMRKRNIVHGPVLTDVPHLFDVPCVVTRDKATVFECGSAAREISVVGLTSLTNGYPLGNRYGEEVCKMKIVYESGRSRSFSLKNGIHFTTVFALNGSSRIDPLAEEAKRFALFGYEKNFEIYVMNRLDIKPDSAENILRVEFTSDSDRYLPLIYGVFAKK